jgi:alkylmercury lyase
MKATTVDIDALAARFLECAPRLDLDGKRMSLALYRLLAEGKAVRVSELAENVELDTELVREKLGGWPGVFFDEDGAIQGYWGLAIPRMAHRFEVGGKTLYTWCAWDSLFLPELLQSTARVSSTCPVTGEDIQLTVHPHAIESVAPSQTVMSFPQVDCMELGEDVVTSFCHFVHFFVSPEAAGRWLEGHPGHVILALDQAFELALRKNALQFGELRSTEGTR